ncbi:MAG: hypothetical protein MSH49_02860 [[Eubacterium] saphenum]|nr:hypothetical protein [[Eubacterium] saphenum]
MKKTVLDKLKMIFFLAYFLILSVERIISLVCVFTGNLSKYDALDWYMTALTLFAIFGAYVFMATKCHVSFKSTEIDLAEDNENYAKLSIAAGILLLGGMVHTEGTIPGIQFASYGMLLGAMGIHTFQCAKRDGNALMKWLSFAYITAFSMSIPVVYHTNIQLKYLFIPIECVVSAGMVVLFTIMLKRFFTQNSESDFSLIPFITAVIGAFAVIILRWNEEINWFVLIAISVTSVLWFLSNILTMVKKKK